MSEWKGIDVKMISTPNFTTQQIVEYEICKSRGHVSFYCFGKCNVCKYCGTHYYYESILREMNAPNPPQD